LIHVIPAPMDLNSLPVSLLLLAEKLYRYERLEDGADGLQRRQYLGNDIVPAAEGALRDKDDIPLLKLQRHRLATEDLFEIDYQQFATGGGEGADDPDMPDIKAGIPEVRSGYRLGKIQPGRWERLRARLFDGTEDKDLLVAVVRDVDRVPGSKPDVLARVAVQQQVGKVDPHDSLPAADPRAAQVGGRIEPVAERKPLDQGQGAVEIVGPGVFELAEQVERLAVVLGDFDHDPWLLDILLQGFLELFTCLRDGEPGDPDCAEKRQMDVSGAVHPAPLQPAGAGWRNTAELRFAGNGHQNHIADTDDVIEGRGGFRFLRRKYYALPFDNGRAGLLDGPVREVGIGRAACKERQGAEEDQGFSGNSE